MKTVRGSRFPPSPRLRRAGGVRGKKAGRLRKWGIWVVLAVSLALNGYWIIRHIGQIGRIKRQKEMVKRVERVVDGDTFDTSDGERVRLKGADAPEYAEECLSEEAKERLAELILEKEVVLKKVEKGHFGRLIGFVFQDDLLIDKVMVEEGLAKAGSGENPEYGVGLLTAEETAKKAKRGIWSDLCLSKKEGCVIKGNFRRDRGTKVYHLPGCFNYEKIVVNEEKGDQWFCSQEEAEAAGFRKSGDCPGEK